MATKKPIKKTAPKKSTTFRSSGKKTATAATRTRKRASSKKRNLLPHLTSNNETFMTVRANRETLYWVVLGIVVITFSIWIMKLQSDIQTIYDQIDQTNSAEISLYNTPIER